MQLSDLVDFISGTPQFRIVEVADASAPVYAFYTQADLEDDLNGVTAAGSAGKQVKTFDAVVVAQTGDVVVSLLSGTASLVQSRHAGYLLTQNYAKLVPSSMVDPRYLVYLFNEHRSIRHQLRMGQQGSITMKYTMRQLKTLAVPPLPPVEKQALIGEAYFSQLRLNALRKRASERETTLVLEAIREADQL